MAISPPYPVSGIINDVDGSTVLENVRVTAFNSNTNEWMIGKGAISSNSLGEYTIDLANFSSGYTDNDVIFILAYIGKYKSMEYRITVDTAIGSTTQTIIMHWQEYFVAPTDDLIQVTRLRAYSASNNHTSALTVDLYARKDDVLRKRIRIQANDEADTFFGGLGIDFEGGIAVIHGDDTADRTQVTMKTDDTR